MTFENNYQSLEDLRRDLSMLTVVELRIKSRQFGIIPGNRKRGELISLIEDAYCGKLVPETPRRPGRPPKYLQGQKQAAAEKDKEKIKQFGATDGATDGATESDIPSNDNDVDTSYDNVDPKLPRVGILEIMPEGGYGFVRTSNFSSTPGKDYYVSANTIQRMNLRAGDKIKVLLHQYPDRPAPTAIYIQEINDQTCSEIKRTPFDALEACFPNERIILEDDKRDYSLRALDLVAPIGKGQRGLIVAPPKTGKTILLKKIAMAVRKNHPEIYVIVLLIDERPEEVTDFKESVDCDVVYSTFDQTPQNHCRVAELVFSNARRRVEQGQDVMILMDSITRLARAYNQTAEQSGRTLTGGLDIAALQEPKKMFGAGRNVRDGGSLTILATALIDTGSRMDDYIYEEFKGTGNMEIQLDRKISERRIFPAIDLNRSSTRRDDLLLTQDQLEGMYLIRRMLSREDPVQATGELLEIIMATNNNNETIETLKRVVRAAAARKRKTE